MLFTWNSQVQVWFLARPCLMLLTTPAWRVTELRLNLQSGRPVVLSRGITVLELDLTNLIFTSSSKPVTPYGEERGSAEGAVLRTAGQILNLLLVVSLIFRSVSQGSHCSVSCQQHNLKTRRRSGPLETI